MPRKINKPSWGGRGGRSGNVDNKHYFGHDDRVSRNDGSFVGPHMGVRPRVVFRKTIRDIARCLDDDVHMASSSKNNNNNNRQVLIREWNRGTQRGRVSPLDVRGFRTKFKQLLPGNFSWYKVIIPYGHKYDKDYVLSNLLSYMAPDTFVPIMYKVVANKATFHIDDEKTAAALIKCDRKITTNDGFKLQVKVLKISYPQLCKIDDKLKERLKQAMEKRYVHETNALDLSRFHHDPDLVTDYFCALFQPLLLKTVLDIVSEHIPNLEALNLEGNKLHLLEKLNVLHAKFSKLKILYIGDNWIRDIRQIDSLKDLKLEELRLAGNPLCNKYESRQSDYVSDVRKRFPKLLRLDGMELPKPILFDVADDGHKIPSSQRMFVSNAKAQEIASQFLQQYFLIFDSENRQPLLDAYDEHACFSMTVSYSNNGSKFGIFSSENRNLYRVNDTNKRQKLLKQGRLPVVSFISEMPQTAHYLDTFTMDISLVTDGMMLITVTGLFKEVDGSKKEPAVRYFNRTFIIVPEGSGYCIRNEQLHVSNPTDVQLKHLSNLTTGQMSQAPMSSNAVKPLPSQLPEDVKQQMTMTLSQQTNMNLEWSLKCLEEVQWNYDNALSAFQEFFKRGQIPAEAFNK
ncbi:nuclear RNA export factor 1 [Calliopsis andreniformis]|uniref:nuclear RNA export factor 1 n=1 Tax=Calliopsis andreniformis TaxID=337506 RepID=UPI003FCC6552